MSSISSLLNLGNTDYYDSMTRKKRDPEEETLTASAALTEEELQQQAALKQIQETADTQKAARKLQQIEQEIEKLSLNQAQLLMQMVSDKILNSTRHQLGDVQVPGERGLLAPAYI